MSFLCIWAVKKFLSPSIDKLTFKPKNFFRTNSEKKVLAKKIDIKRFFLSIILKTSDHYNSSLKNRVYTSSLHMQAFSAFRFGRTYLGFHRHLSTNVSSSKLQCRKPMCKWDVATRLNTVAVNLLLKIFLIRVFLFALNNHKIHIFIDKKSSIFFDLMTQKGFVH